MKLLKTLIVSFSLAAPLAVFAQSNATPKFDQRQASQEQRIQQGTQSGSLTQKEAANLQKGQNRLQAKEDRAKADGVVTQQERKNLQKAENKQSQQIYSQKHDRQHDYNHDGKKDRPSGIK